MEPAFEAGSFRFRHPAPQKGDSFSTEQQNRLELCLPKG